MKNLLYILALAILSSPTMAKEMKAIFAGGCFWCMEEAFEKLPGVKSVLSGYIDGHEKNPTYKRVAAGLTGHTEAIEVKYDATKVSYQTLLLHFWKNIDPTVKDRQFCDNGSQYRSGIYYIDPAQKELASQSLKQVEKLFGNVHTELKKAAVFYVAEKYHQDYYKKNPVRYKYYKYSCGRSNTLERIWKDKNLEPLFQK